VDARRVVVGGVAGWNTDVRFGALLGPEETPGGPVCVGWVFFLGGHSWPGPSNALAGMHGLCVCWCGVVVVVGWGVVVC
jgi:hypothetical protein